MRVTVTPVVADVNSTVTVEVDYYDGFGYRTELSNLAPTPIPSTFKLGFSAGTGARYDYHLVRFLSVRSRLTC